MKRILICILILLLLSACTPAAVSPAEKPGTPESGEKAPEPEPVPEPEPEPVPEPEPEPEPSLFDGSEPSEYSPVLVRLSPHYVDNEIFPTACALGDNLLIVFRHETGIEESVLELCLFSMKSGELLAQDTLPVGSFYSIHPAGDCVLISDTGNYAVSIFDSSLNVTTYPVYETDAYVFTDPSGSRIYTYYYKCESNAAAISVLDTESGERYMLDPPGKTLFLDSAKTNTLYLPGSDSEPGDPETCVFSPATGELSPLPFDGNCYCTGYDNGCFLAEYRNTDGVFRLGDGEDSVIFYSDAFSSEFCADSGLVLLRGDVIDEGEWKLLLSLYRKDGTFVSSLKLNYNIYLNQNLVFCPEYNGCILAVTDYNKDENELLFWDFSVPCEGEDLEMIPISTFEPDPDSGDAVAAVLYERAQALGDRYGLEINIADRAQLDYEDYTADICTDYWAVSRGLDELETALSYYPENYFPQLPHGDLEKIVIELTGHLTTLYFPEDGDGFSSALGFVQYTGGAYTLVMDVTDQGELASSFCHEFSHMTDSKLLWDYWTKEDAYFNDGEWCRMNPEDFGYSNSYYYMSDSMQRDRYYDYFVDDYSRTYPTEDRARIMEYAVSSDWVFEDAEGLLAKLDYYSRAIRDGMDTEGWPDVLKWEEPLYKYGYRQMDVDDAA